MESRPCTHFFALALKSAAIRTLALKSIRKILYKNSPKTLILNRYIPGSKSKVKRGNYPYFTIFARPEGNQVQKSKIRHTDRLTFMLIQEINTIKFFP